MRIDLRLEGPDFRFGQQVFLFLQFLGLVDRFEDVADAVKEFGACIGEGVSFGFGGEDGADDFALVLDGKGDEVREVRKRVLQVSVSRFPHRPGSCRRRLYNWFLYKSDHYIRWRPR